MEKVEKHPEYNKMQRKWARVRDCLEGEEQVKAKGTLYLPRPTGMNEREYESYVQRASFFPATSATLSSLKGIITRVQPIIEHPPGLEDFLEEMNGWAGEEGTPFFVSKISEELLSMGRVGILLDPNNQPNKPPYVAIYAAEDILDWVVEKTENGFALTYVLLQEMQRDTIVYIALKIESNKYVYEKFIEKKDKNNETKLEIIESNVVTVRGKSLDYIPFILKDTNKNNTDPGKPPLLDLCDTNLAHYRVSADYYQGIHLSAVATPVICGHLNEGDTPHTIGPGHLWVLPQDAKVSVLEFSGQSIGAIKQALDDLKKDMELLGAKLVDASRRNESAETAQMRYRHNFSLLNTVAEAIESSLEVLLKWVCEWQGCSENEIKVTMPRDWVDSKLGPEQLRALLQAWQLGAISQETLHNNLQQGEIIPYDKDFQEELTAIQMESGLTSVFMRNEQV